MEVLAALCTSELASFLPKHECRRGKNNSRSNSCLLAVALVAGGSENSCTSLPSFLGCGTFARDGFVVHRSHGSSNLFALVRRKDTPTTTTLSMLLWSATMHGANVI